MSELMPSGRTSPSCPTRHSPDARSVRRTRPESKSAPHSAGSGVQYAIERLPFNTIPGVAVPEGLAERLTLASGSLIADAMAAEAELRFEDALGILGRDRGPFALDAWWPNLTMDEKRRLIVQVWEEAERPVPYFGESQWVAMFKETGFISDGPLRPTEPKRVWRGAPVASKGRGMSWSYDRTQAEAFASRHRKRFGIPTTVFSAVIPPTAILALNGFSDESRGEQEAIVNPRMLKGRVAAA
jgi:hypothetical protein